METTTINAFGLMTGTHLIDRKGYVQYTYEIGTTAITYDARTGGPAMIVVELLDHRTQTFISHVGLEWGETVEIVVPREEEVDSPPWDK